MDSWRLRTPYNRQLLLAEDRRNDVLELWEVEQYGRDSFDDANYVSVYGLKPAHWHARGVRLLARTAVECTRDKLADLIGRDIAVLARTAPTGGGTVVIDPFAGSCNTLYWIERHVVPDSAIGFELDDAVFNATHANLSILDIAISLSHGDGIATLSA